MTALAYRHWVPSAPEHFVQAIARETAGQSSAAIAAAIDAGIALNRRIHEADCINLNPATNVMNPKAEAALAWQVTQSLPLVATWPAKEAVPSAPLVPSPVNDPLWQESHRLALTAVWPVTPMA